ncbi:MAG: response regulator [Desulfobacterales bacterium]|nr:response regulator [Desulfobacterales bacterium]
MAKILVADDSQANRYALEKLLSAAGYDVVTAGNGQEAVEEFKKNKPDLVVMDLHMPIMDGFEAARQIRRDNDPIHIPIIFISATYKDLASKTKALDLGGNDYLTIPIEPEELIARVKAMLRVKRLHDDLSNTNEQLKKEIKERKRAEESLRKHKEQLEALLAEVADKNSELESFVYTVSHELKNPIVTIAGFIGALQEDFGNALSGQGNEYIRYVSDAVRKMELFINQLLDLSRIGHLTEKEAEFPFAGLVEEALEVLQPRIKARDIAVYVQEDLPVIYGERMLLGRVVDNLLANAVKYIGKDNPSPSIEVGAQQQDGQMTFFVRDNGIGIDEDHAKGIFEVFHRLHTPKEYPGTGIGIAVCKKIVKRHSGKIRVESEPAKGSTFYFTIPARR